MTDVLDRLRKALADRYTIEREIGAGGMATVYLAEDLKHHRKVAIKVLRADLAATLGPERFLREIEVAARLQHPHILPLHDSGEADGFLYYVMPFVEGQSLREKLAKEGELPIGEAVRIVRDVVDALTAAHAHGVVHRDIKPENILLSGRHALVTDFGVAKAVSEATGREQLTTAGVALGTPAYMAPEQAAADPHLDHRVDLYAVGAVAYELLTGRPVFMGTTPQMVLSAHVTEAPQPVTKHRETVPVALESVVMRCLEKKPADRWQSAEELLPQLEALTTPSGGMTPAETAPVVAARPKRRWALLGGVLAVAVVGALGAWYLLAGREPTLGERRVVVAPFADLTGEPEYADLGRIAANYVTQKLLETDLISVVPATDVAGFAFTSNRELAEATGASLVIAGDYYLQGDSLLFRSEIIDVSASEVLAAPGVAGAARDERMEAVEALRQRVTGALAVHVDPDLEDWAGMLSSTPTFEAYREWTLCGERFNTRAYRDAIEHCVRAYELDTTFVEALWLTAIAHINRSEDAQADSLYALIEPRQERLSELARINLRWLRARIDGNLPDRLRLMRQASERGGEGTTWRYQQALEANRNNRPYEAIEVLETLDPAAFGDWFFYWTVLADAYHMIGDYEEELEVARRGREHFPDELALLNVMVRALIGLGRVDDARELLNESLTLESSGYSSGGSMRAAALELKAHGFVDEATSLLERAVEWYRSQPPDRRTALRRSLAYTLLCQGNLDGAAGHYRELRSGEPETVGHLGYLGVIAARSGRTAEARAIDDSLAAWDLPYARGVHTSYRAGIAAWLGEKDRAIALLQQAFREGNPYSVTMHSHPAFEPLWGYGPFEEFLEPRR